jgi:HEPN domain-containing protein
MKKSKVDLVRNWLEKARRDLMTAKNGLGSSDPFTGIICFHAQQAGEKYIKAYLVWQEIDFPKTHSLEDLILLATPKDSSFFRLIEEATLLTPYAVEVRYGESEEPLFEDAEKAVEVAGEIREFVLERFPDEIVKR